MSKFLVIFRGKKNTKKFPSILNPKLRTSPYSLVCLGYSPPTLPCSHPSLHPHSGVLVLHPPPLHPSSLWGEEGGRRGGGVKGGGERKGERRGGGRQGRRS
eukprot:TRINITY_DN3888_c0_g1_i3.p1 TRINITY_DN3888_c0_g1~~TRINITY_DN3888_c0_g1_i3.p1  ORF type:complete len:101 (-),score=23.49 TRINITY_DN3888_c0_g1_i3:355-657(-)